MKNVFENAYFGKQYRLRNGKMAIYIDKRHYHYLIVEGGCITFPYNDDGSSHAFDELDVVSEWNEPINEEELDEPAKDYISKNSIPYEPLPTLGVQKETFKRSLP